MGRGIYKKVLGEGPWRDETLPHFDCGGVSCLYAFVKSLKMYNKMGKIYRV